MSGDSLETDLSRRQRRAATGERRFLQPGQRGASTPHERWRMTVRGRVQGVGYRAACHRRAIELGLGGWVRNRSDAAVELEAEGPPRRLGELRIWCEQGPPSARVSSVSISQMGVEGSDWFEIRA
jgi:acylphosphatase